MQIQFQGICYLICNCRKRIWQFDKRHCLRHCSAVCKSGQWRRWHHRQPAEIWLHNYLIV